MGETSMSMIGKLLRRTQRLATTRFTHLSAGPMREAANLLEVIFLQAFD